MKRLISGALFLCVLGLFVQPVLADEGGGGGKGGNKGGDKMSKADYDPKASFEKFSSKLNLTPEQKEKIRPILNDEVAAIRAAHQEAMDKEMKLIEENRARVNAILTPEQQKKFNDMRDERIKKCRKDMDKHAMMMDLGGGESTSHEGEHGDHK